MELTSLSATMLAGAIRTKIVSAVEVVDAYLARIGVVNPKLNAVVQLNAEVARKQALQADDAVNRGEVVGPLHGVPITIKDSLDTAGMVSPMQTPPLSGQPSVPPPARARSPWARSTMPRSTIAIRLATGTVSTSAAPTSAASPPAPSDGFA